MECALIISLAHYVHLSPTNTHKLSYTPQLSVSYINCYKLNAGKEVVILKTMTFKQQIR